MISSTTSRGMAAIVPAIVSASFSVGMTAATPAIGMAAPLVGGSLIPHTSVLQRQLRQQTPLHGDAVAVAVAQFEILVAQLEHRDIGIGAGPQRADRALVSHDLR